MSINNIKRFVLYMIYILPLLCLTSWAEQYPRYLKSRIQAQGDSYMWGLIIFIAVVPISIGLMFALPRFVKLTKAEGLWRFDWVKFLAIGLPTLYGTLYPSVYWYGVEMPPLNTAWIMPYPLSGIIFGFILLTAFDKLRP